MFFDIIFLELLVCFLLGFSFTREEEGILFFPAIKFDSCKLNLLLKLHKCDRLFPVMNVSSPSELY